MLSRPAHDELRGLAFFGLADADQVRGDQAMPGRKRRAFDPLPAWRDEKGDAQSQCLRQAATGRDRHHRPLLGPPSNRRRLPVREASGAGSRRVRDDRWQLIESREARWQTVSPGPLGGDYFLSSAPYSMSARLAWSRRMCKTWPSKLSRGAFFG